MSGRVAVREDESPHSRWMLPLMFLASALIVVWSLKQSNSIPPLDPSLPRNERLRQQTAQGMFPTTSQTWEREGWDVPSSTCRQTKFVPFKTGCPITCCGYRADEGLGHSQQPMYRFGLVWDFGKLFPEMHDYNVNLTDANLEERLNVSAPVARLFARAETTLASNAGVDLKPKVQNYMHLALSYFCCMTESEVKRIVTFVRDYLKEGGATTKSRSQRVVSARVARLECWRERIDSVTNILVLDNSTQRKLLNLHDDVNDYLLQRAKETPGTQAVAKVLEAMPTRSEQMPFHVTLLGLAAPREAGTFQPGNVSKYVPSIADTVALVNNQMATSYLDPDAFSDVRAVDLRTTPIACHSNCDIDHS